MNILYLIAQTTTAVAEESTSGTAESVPTPSFSAWAVALGIGLLFGLAFLVMFIAWRRTWHWNDEEHLERLRGLALPSGTTRSVLALLIVGGFVLFAFIGRGILGAGDQYNAIFGAWVTLTGTVTGFYFGSRVGQNLDDSDDEMAQKAARARARAKTKADADAAKTKADADAEANKAIADADTAAVEAKAEAKAEATRAISHADVSAAQTIADAKAEATMAISHADVSAAQTIADAKAEATMAISDANVSAAQTIADAKAKAIKTIAEANVVAAQKMAGARGESSSGRGSTDAETHGATDPGDDGHERQSQAPDPKPL